MKVLLQQNKCFISCHPKFELLGSLSFGGLTKNKALDTLYLVKHGDPLQISFFDTQTHTGDGKHASLLFYL